MIGPPEVLSQADKINVVIAVAGCIAAVSALATVIIAVKEAVRSRRERTASEKCRVYDMVVLDPLMKSLRHFSSGAGRALRSECRRIESFDATLVTHAMILDQCKKAAEAFSEAFFAVRAEVRAALIAWNDLTLTVRVGNLMEEVQDSVVNAMSTAASRRSSSTEVPLIVVDRTAAVIQLLVGHRATISA
ncbi:MAG: hypothetical protein ACREL5_12325 [Gemmatimonadales bacterium]